MTVEIPQAHAEAIAERKQLLQQVSMHFQILMREDKRHVDAVLKSLGHNPAGFAQYDLRMEDGRSWLDLTPAAQQQQAPQAAPAAAVNGAPAVPVAAN